MIALVKRTLALTLPFLWKGRKNLLASLSTLAMVLISTLVSTATPPLLGYLLQHYHTQSIPTVAGTLGLLLLCWGGRLTLYHLRAIVFFGVINQAIRDIRLQVVIRLHQIPIQDWAQYGVTEIVSASTRVSSCIRRCMSISLVTILPSMLKLVACTMALIYTYPYTWYFPLLAMLSYVVVYADVMRLLELRLQLWDNTDRVNTAMDDSLHNTKFSRFHLSQETERLEQLFDQEARGWLRNNFFQHRIALLQALLFSMSLAALIIPLILRMRAGQLGVSDFVVIKGYAFVIRYQIQKIAVHLRRLFNSAVDLKKILDLLAMPIDTAASDTLADRTFAQKSYAPTDPVLQMRDVSFAYKDGKPILQAVSLDIHPGDQIVIMGSSGQGKSTLCHLLAGIYQPQQGEVLLRGTPLRLLSPTTIGRYIHIVTQDAHLIHDSIAANLATDATATQEQALLGDLSKRWHTPVGDVDSVVSSGERQRILIARCLSYKPEVLILDETFNALDVQSAQALLQQVLNAVPTVVLVTHHRSLAQRLQRVYELAQGTLTMSRAVSGVANSR